jgi:hypothetical protein
MEKYINLSLIFLLVFFLQSAEAAIVWYSPSSTLSPSEQKTVREFLLDYAWPSGRLFRKDPALIQDHSPLFDKRPNAEIDFLNGAIKSYMIDNNKDIQFIQAPTLIWDLYVLKELLRTGEAGLPKNRVEEKILNEFIPNFARELAQDHPLNLDRLTLKMIEYLQSIYDSHT